MLCNNSLSNEEINRYSRQIRLPEIGKEGQERIKSASVLVVGAGALGCPVLQYLTASGVGIIGILDNDWVDTTNLNRQILYSDKDSGKPKPLVAREKLKCINPEVTFKIHFIKLDKDSALKIIAQYDIIVDCTDNFPSRFLINDSCVILHKPLVYGAIHKFSGQVTVLNCKGGPTLRCLYPEPPNPIEVPSCEEFGTIGPVPGIIGSMQATEVLKIILGLDGVLSGKMFTIDTINFNTSIFSFERNPHLSLVTELGEYEEGSLCNAGPVIEISAAKLRKMLHERKRIVVVDLRDREDNSDIGFNVIPIPYYEVIQKIDYLTGKEAVIFYCRSGNRSRNVINYLQREYDLHNLYSLVI